MGNITLADIARGVRKTEEGKGQPDQEFLNSLEQFIRLENKPRVVRPNFKPSMIGGCIRQLYYCNMEYEPTEELPSANLVGMGETGSARHDAIQAYIDQMCDSDDSAWEWVSVPDYIMEKEIKDLYVVSQIGYETKLYHKEHDLSFMCDGIVRHKETGEYYIFEYKTTTVGKYSGALYVLEEHEAQATSYSLALEIDKVIFVYENRDFCEKKAFLYEPTKEEKQEILDKITVVRNHMKDKKVPKKIVDTSGTEATSHSCRYCKYKPQCKKDGEG